MKAGARALQRMPYFRGRDRLKRSLLARSGKAVVEVEGLSLELNLTDAHAQHVYLHRRFPGPVWRLVRDLAGPGMTVVDVGANLGYVTLCAARAVGPRGRVLAFEPNRRAFDQLAANVRRNGFDWVTANRLACSDEEGEVELHVPQISSEYASLRPREFAGSTTETEPVRVVRLDSRLEEPPDLLKIDVEGAEWGVLRGLGDLLGKPRLILEASHDNASRFGYSPIEMLDWLRDVGYRVQTVRDHELVPFDASHIISGAYADVLCTPV